MDPGHMQKPILATRCRDACEHSCLDCNDRLQSIPFCECEHLSIGTEEWFEPPLHTHSQPIPLTRNESTTMSDDERLRMVHSPAPRKTVTWASSKEVRLFYKKRPVSESSRPSRSVLRGNTEETGKSQKNRWWSLSRLMTIFKPPLYTTKWEDLPDGEDGDVQDYSD
ncbi:hypothetical protein BZA77DRAFT_357296 [Pyronema omphalodes]|nr:hypothetical protein BZA77DRAFT_357296 [Pyronema omphalodes]